MYLQSRSDDLGDKAPRGGLLNKDDSSWNVNVSRGLMDNEPDDVILINPSPLLLVSLPHPPKQSNDSGFSTFSPQMRLYLAAC